MDTIPSSTLKSILLAKWASMYYLEHCRVLVNGGRVEYVTDEGKRSLYWNIPIANTKTVLLGTGTSVTQAAMRELAKAGVLAGFCGGGGTPLFSANEIDIEGLVLAAKQVSSRSISAALGAILVRRQFAPRRSQRIPANSDRTHPAAMEQAQPTGVMSGRLGNS
jgi:CRISPR/Cas system-associated endonuclease Cas1